jgi:hypothetical protein
MLQGKSAFLPLAAAAALAASLTPGCSGNNQATAQTAFNLSLQPLAGRAQDCQVGPGIQASVGNTASVTTVADGSNASGVKVGVQCTVSGSDTSGYQFKAKAIYGTLDTIEIAGNIPPIAGGMLPTVQNVDVAFSSGGGGFIANLSDSTCKLTFPNGPPSQGVAAGQIAGTISCQNEQDSKIGATCDLEGTILFENCGK